MMSGVTSSVNLTQNTQTKLKLNKKKCVDLLQPRGLCMSDMKNTKRNSANQKYTHKNLLYTNNNKNKIKCFFFITFQPKKQVINTKKNIVRTLNKV